MILSSNSIKSLLKSGELVIKPLDTEQIQPASIDLRIAGEIMILDKQEQIDFENEKEVSYEKIKGDFIVLPGKTHVLVRTVEKVELPKTVAGITKLRSSLSRIGIILNNAGWIDPGFKGTITMSLFNPHDFPVRIKSGKRVAQLILLRLDKESDEGYQGKYLGQKEVTGVR